MSPLYNLVIDFLEIELYDKLINVENLYIKKDGMVFGYLDF